MNMVDITNTLKEHFNVRQEAPGFNTKKNIFHGIIILTVLIMVVIALLWVSKISAFLGYSITVFSVVASILVVQYVFKNKIHVANDNLSFFDMFGDCMFDIIICSCCALLLIFISIGVGKKYTMVPAVLLCAIILAIIFKYSYGVLYYTLIALGLLIVMIVWYFS